MICIKFDTGTLEINPNANLTDIPIANFRKILKLAERFGWLNSMREIKRECVEQLERQRDFAKRLQDNFVKDRCSQIKQLDGAILRPADRRHKEAVINELRNHERRVESELRKIDKYIAVVKQF